MFSFVLAIGISTTHGVVSNPELWCERVLSWFVLPGASCAQVESLLGEPFGIDSYGPPGECYTVYTYFLSGVHVTFGPDEKVVGVSR